MEGSIEPGKWADHAVRNDDMLAVPADQVTSIKVEMTVAGGGFNERA